MKVAFLAEISQQHDAGLEKHFRSFAERSSSLNCFSPYFVEIFSSWLMPSCIFTCSSHVPYFVRKVKLNLKAPPTLKKKVRKLTGRQHYALCVHYSSRYYCGLREKTINVSWFCISYCPSSVETFICNACSGYTTSAEFFNVAAVLSKIIWRNQTKSSTVFSRFSFYVTFILKKLVTSIFNVIRISRRFKIDRMTNSSVFLFRNHWLKVYF